MRNLLITLAAATSVSIASAAGIPSTSNGDAIAPRYVSDATPPVIGFIRNRAGGQITLASESCSAKQGTSFAFIKDDGGKISLTGCWSMVGDDVVIVWSDGDVYSYPITAIQFTPSFDEWYERKNRPKGKSTIL